MRTAGLLITIAALQCAACESEPDTSLEEARARWEKNRPEKYVIEECFSGLTSGCKQVAVSGTRVTAARLIDDSILGTRTLDPSSVVEPVEAGFLRAAGIDGCRSEASFDATYGYAYASYSKCRTESTIVRVTCFKPGANDLDACGAPSGEGGAGGAGGEGASGAEN